MGLAVCYDARVKRRLFNLVAGVSLVLCSATLIVWVPSYFVAGGIAIRFWDDEIYERGSQEREAGVLVA